MRFVLLLFISSLVILTIFIKNELKSNADVPSPLREEVMEQDLVTSDTSPQSLNYALQNISQPSQSPPPPARPPDPQDSDSLGPQVEHYIREIQSGSDQALFSLEKGLSETSQGTALNYKLALIQAALNLSADEGQLRNIAMREMSYNIVPNASDNMPARDGLTHTDQIRMVVTASFKLYLNATHDAETVYNDALRVLTLQPDPATRQMIIYDAIERYPELRERLNQM